VLSNLNLPRATAVLAYSYGVTLANGADALIFQSTIQGGYASTESAAVVSVGATLALEDSALSFSDGTVLNGAFERVLALEDSPGSRVERSTVSGSLTFNAGGAQRIDAIAIHGDATGTIVRHNTINPQFGGFGATTAALALTDCGGASPWIADNTVAPSNSDGNSIDAIYAAGDCHPVIDGNVSIGVNTYLSDSPNAVHCAALSGVSSRCVVSRNQSIGSNLLFSGQNSIQTAVGVLCESTSCSRIDQNGITAVNGSTFSASAGHQVTGRGVVLSSSSALVDRNSITGVWSSACANRGYGISGGAASSRVQNNRIYGSKISSLPPGCSIAQQFSGIQAAAGQVYSNHITAWPSGQCSTSFNGDPRLYGVLTGSGGNYRNNAIEGCASVKEADASSDPGVFENNSIPGGYLDEGGDFPNGFSADRRIFAPQVNALSDMTVSGNIGDACYAAGSDTLAAGSPCIGAGTPSGAPSFDYDGMPRDAQPDIGSDEY
jgi:hypothetical protein